MVKTERDKIRVAVAITIGVKPDVFAPEVRGCVHNRAIQDAALKTVGEAYTRYVKNLREILRAPIRKIGRKPHGRRRARNDTTFDIAAPKSAR